MCALWHLDVEVTYTARDIRALLVHVVLVCKHAHADGHVGYFLWEGRTLWHGSYVRKDEWFDQFHQRKG